MFPAAAPDPASLDWQLTNPLTPITVPTEAHTTSSSTFFTHDGDHDGALHFLSPRPDDASVVGFEDCNWTEDQQQASVLAHSHALQTEWSVHEHCDAANTSAIAPDGWVDLPPVPSHQQEQASSVQRSSWQASQQLGSQLRPQHDQPAPQHYHASSVQEIQWTESQQLESQRPQHLLPAPSAHTTPIAPIDTPSHPDSSLAAHSHAPQLTRPKMARRACLSCRSMKLACSDVRPCSRCARVGRPCVDQTDDEVHPATRRPKRTVAMAEQTPHVPIGPFDPSPAAAAPSNALPPPAVGFSTPEIDRLSRDLNSRSVFAVAIELGIRDTMLRTHAQVTAMRPPLSTLVEWHTQCTFSLLHLADVLAVADFETFLIGGLTEEELSSPNWLSSPLAPWRHLSTRPLHFTFQPNTTLLKNHLAGVGAPLDAAATHDDDDQSTTSDPELRMEWLPAAHFAFHHWQNALEARLRYERQLQQTRARMLAGTDENTDTCSMHVHAGTTSSDDDGASGLTDRFIALGIGRALSVPPPPATQHDRIYFVHARWCPLGSHSVQQHDDDDANKVKRTIGMECVRATTDDDPDGALQAECCCKNSSPLPLRVFVNTEFEKLFGWRRIDVELGLQQEGFPWNRRWTPPSQWPRLHRPLLMQLQPTVGHLLSPELGAEDARYHRDAEASNAEPHICLTRTGASVMIASRSLAITKTKGAHALILGWKKMTDSGSSSDNTNNSGATKGTQTR